MSKGNVKRKKPNRKTKIEKEELKIRLAKLKTIRSDQNATLFQTRFFNCLKIIALIGVLIILIALFLSVVLFAVFLFIMKNSEMAQAIANVLQWIIGTVSFIFGFWGWLLTYRSTYSRKEIKLDDLSIDVTSAKKRPDSFTEETDINTHTL